MRVLFLAHGLPPLPFPHRLCDINRICVSPICYGQRMGSLSLSHWFLLAIALCLYFAPTLVAIRRLHVSRSGIAVVNLFLGWTFLGWVGALAWAYSGRNNREDR